MNSRSQHALIIPPEITLLGLSTDIPASCYRCGPVAPPPATISSSATVPDRRVAEISNIRHHNQHCPRCAGPMRLLIEWFDPDDRSCEIPEDKE